MKKGDVYWVSITNETDHIQSGIRPYIVISNDKNNKYSDNVTVVPVTSRLKRPWMPTHVVIPQGDIFKKRSQVLAETIMTVTKEKLQLGEYLGQITDANLMQQITQAAYAQIGS